MPITIIAIMAPAPGGGNKKRLLTSVIYMCFPSVAQTVYSALEEKIMQMP